MHELSLVLSMVSLAEAEMARGGCAGRVERLNLTVGALSGASPEALRAAFSIVAPQKGWPVAELAITETPAISRCLDCGARREVRELVLDCPRCGGPCTLEGGRELELTSIDLAD